MVFPDFPDFQPNLTPKQVLQTGAFGGTYFRPIHSAITGHDYAGDWREFPDNWFEGLDESKVRTLLPHAQGLFPTKTVPAMDVRSP